MKILLNMKSVITLVLIEWTYERGFERKEGIKA